ncbi:hypothetical protein ACFSLT_18450 [Novosphingobium resinovorum]
MSFRWEEAVDEQVAGFVDVVVGADELDAQFLDPILNRFQSGGCHGDSPFSFAGDHTLPKLCSKRLVIRWRDARSLPHPLLEAPRRMT